jgi:hypothetical protein
MSRAVVVAVLSALVLTARADAKVPKACKRLHGHARAVCVKKKQKAAAAKPIPVTTTLLSGSTMTASAGTFEVSGTLTGSIPAQAALNTPTVDSISTGTLAAAAGAPCAAPQLPAPNPYGPPAGVLILNADGTVLASLHVTLPDCGGATTLLLGGEAGQGGLDSLVLDSVPGPVTAHLVVKVDLGHP